MPTEAHPPVLRPGPIQSLPPDTRSLLGSTLLLPDVPAILVALVNNALASQPSKIRIELQLTQDSGGSAWPSVTCSDDGSGFAKAWLEDAGKLVHGTLASMAQVGNLEALTLPHIGGKSAGWWSVLGEHGLVRYAGPIDKEAKSNRHGYLTQSPFSRGSSVRVGNIFAAVPVRRKLLVSNAKEAQSACVRALQTLALRAPRVSFELITHGQGKTATLLKLRSVEKQAARIGDVIGMPIDECQEIDATTSLELPHHTTERGNSSSAPSASVELRLRGLLILSPVARSGRVIFWGNCLLEEDSDEGEALHAVLSRLLAKLPAASDGAATNVSHRPGYVLELDVRSPLSKESSMHNEGEPAVRRSLVQSVVSGIEHIVGEALRQRVLLQASTNPRKRASQEPQPFRASAIEEPASLGKEQPHTRTPAALQRFKKYKKRPSSSFGDRLRSISEQNISQSLATSSTTAKAVLQDQGQTSHAKGASSSSTSAKPTPTQHSNSMVDILGRSYTVDPRTGSSFRPSQPSFRLPAKLGSGNVDAPRTPDWLRDALQGWNDPVLPAPAEQPVSQASPLAAQGVDGVSSDGLLEGAALDKVRVLAQMESKFIACVLPCAQSSCLVLVDQHAADERVRFEAFLRPFLQAALSSDTGPDSFSITKPLLFKLHAPHARTLLESQAQAALARWGFELASNQCEDDEDHNVSVLAVPLLLHERLTSEHASLENVLLDLASWLEQGGARKLDAARAVLARRKSDAAAQYEHSLSAQHEWMNAMRHLPSSLLRLIASKSCRGAVMFGDPLEQQQCQRLVAELNRTALPLQCAHGRPTIVSLCKPDKLSVRRKVDWAHLHRL